MAERPSPKLLIGEALTLVGVFVGVYLYISLFSYDPGDLDADGEVTNLGGALGARLAEAMLSAFGNSSFLIIAFVIYAIWIYQRMLSHDQYSVTSLLSSMFGLILLINSSCGLETLRLYVDSAALPAGSGGWLGSNLAKTLHGIFGFQGATLILVGLWLSSLSLFAYFSWVNVSEYLGDWIGDNWRVVFAFAAYLRKRFGAFLDDGEDDEPSITKQGRKARKPRLRAAPKEPATEPRAARGAVEPTLGEGKAAASEKKEARMPAPAPVTGEHTLPPMELLAEAMSNVKSLSDEELHRLAALIETKLEEFGVKAKVVEILPGPVITRFELKPDTGVKGVQIMNLLRDLSRALSVTSIRVLETIAGKTTMGLEIPNAERDLVSLQEVLSSPAYIGNSSPLAIALGKDIAGETFVSDLAEMPHLLVAGTTGSGKSVQINAMILSLLYKAGPDKVRLILIDPKVVELAPFDDLPHLLAPVVTDMNLVPTALSWCVAEMERRYQLMARLGVRNLAGLNEAIAKGASDPDGDEELEQMPKIVVVVDELADLMAVAGKKVEQLICRLAQKARAAGIHLILATQRPSVDVITGLIKANVPSRIAFKVSSRIDSRTILDQGGAESLLGKGDMLFLAPGSPEVVRVHGAFVSDDEVRKVADHIRSTSAQTEKIDFSFQAASAAAGGDGEAGEADPLYEQAVEVLRSNNRCSISLVQRHLRIGYNRAARILEDMERAGIISPMDAAGNRKILAPSEGADGK